MFLYDKVLHANLGLIEAIERAQRPRCLPVVLTRAEARAVLDRMRGTNGLVAQLL